MKKLLQLSMLLVATMSFGQTPIQTFNFEDNLTNLANNITLIGSTGVGYEDGLPGKGKALVFNDTHANPITARAIGGISNMPLNTSNRSFSFWLKVPAQAGLPSPSSTTPEQSRIFRIGGTIAASPAAGFEFRRTNYTASGINTRFEIYDSGNSNIIGALNDSGVASNFVDKWRFYTIVYQHGSQGNIALYLDGQNIGNFSGQLDIGITNSIVFGGGPENNQFSIDKFQIYDIPLSSTQILAIYKQEILPVVPSPQAKCSGQSVASIDVIEIPNVGASLKFYRQNNLVPNSFQLVQGAFQVTQTINGIESDRASVGITVSTTAIPSIPSTIQVCIPNGFYDLQDLPTSPGTNIKWYAAATGGSALTNVTPIITGTTYYASQTIGVCESSRTAVLVNTGLPNTPVVSQGSVSLPSGSTIADLVATPTGFVVWYSSEANATSGTNPLPTSTPLLDNTTYYGKTEISGCRSSGRILLTVTLPILSVSDFNTNLKFNLFPNPSSNLLNIDLATELKSVEVYSLQGQKVLSATAKSINIANIAVGTYIVKVEDIEGVIGTNRFIKE